LTNLTGPTRFAARDSKVYTVSGSRTSERGTGRNSYDGGAFRTQDNSAGKVMRKKTALNSWDLGIFVFEPAPFMEFQKL
jgi:hypothetical protein